MTRLLVLGGSSFVGRAIVDDALQRGWEVTTFNRGLTNAPDARVKHVIGDRTDPTSLSTLATSEWDLVTDTWAGAPTAVRDSARLLADRADGYAYISSASVYAPPPPVGGDERSPTVDGSPDAGEGDYAACKRGAELAVLDAFGEPRTLLARAGLIVGPYENVGRLPWWLARMARGGSVLAPGPPERKLQLIDSRDLARFVLDAASARRFGTFNTVSRAGHATTETLLGACVDAAGAPDLRLRWVSPELVARAGLQPWSQLPLWLPPGHEYEGLLAADVEHAHAAGLRCRPIEQTVADTWSWMCSLPAGPPARPGRSPLGMTPEVERAALALAQ